MTGFFRTELLTKESTSYATPSIEDYAERNAAQREFWESQNGQRSGRPGQARPVPERNSHLRPLSTSLAFD